MPLIFTDLEVGLNVVQYWKICNYPGGSINISKLEKIQHSSALPNIKYHCAILFLCQMMFLQGVNGIQWQIQDPGYPWKWGKNLIFGKIFAKNLDMCCCIILQGKTANKMEQNRSCNFYGLFTMIDQSRNSHPDTETHEGAPGPISFIFTQFSPRTQGLTPCSRKSWIRHATGDGNVHFASTAGARSKNSATNHSTFQKKSELFSIGGGHVVPVVNNTTCSVADPAAR